MFYLFHHIPKMGGTSANKAFREIFKVIRDYHAGTDSKSLEDYQANKVDIGQLKEDQIICGHYNMRGSRLWERYPELSSMNVRKISIFRDPFETAKSGVRFNIKRGIALRENADKALNQRIGYIHRMLGCTDENYKEVIDTYYAIGLTDTLQEFFTRLAQTLDSLPPRVEKLNATKPDDELFSEKAVVDFQSKNQLDNMIFDYAKERAYHFLQHG